MTVESKPSPPLPSNRESESARSQDPTIHFHPRHIGPRPADVDAMLDALGEDSLDSLVKGTVPDDIRLYRPLELGLPEWGLEEHAALERLRTYKDANRVLRSYIGQGYHDTLTPGVIQRNILENPGWYTAYTPYQARSRKDGSRPCSTSRP